MSNYTYYRCMSKQELDELSINCEQYGTELNRTTYWTNSYSAAELYKDDNRVIVEVILDRDIPKAYHGIAHGEDYNGQINNHHEVKMSREMANDFLINMMEMHIYP